MKTGGLHHSWIGLGVLLIMLGLGVHVHAQTNDGWAQIAVLERQMAVVTAQRAVAQSNLTHELAGVDLEAKAGRINSAEQFNRQQAVIRKHRPVMDQCDRELGKLELRDYEVRRVFRLPARRYTTANSPTVGVKKPEKPATLGNTSAAKPPKT